MRLRSRIPPGPMMMIRRVRLTHRSEPASAAGPVQPAPEPDSGRHVTRAAEPPDASASDYDLERLEAGLRWLQRQEAATRLARANQPPPRRTSTLLDARDRRLSGERFVERFGSPISLEPERLTPPPGPGRHLRVPLAILVAASSRRRRSTTFCRWFGPIAGA